MRIALLGFFIELALAVVLWFFWKPLTGFFAILSVGGLARYVATTSIFWARKGAFIVGLIYGVLMALLVCYGTLLWGDGLIQKIGLGIWGLIAVQYVSYGAPKYSPLHENQYVIDMGATIAYIVLALILFLVPGLI